MAAAPEDAAAPPEGATGQGPASGYPAELNRRLCAAVWTDRRLARVLIEDVLNEESRAIAVSPGTDLATVAWYALRAQRRKTATDVTLFLVLYGLGMTAALRVAGLTGRVAAEAGAGLLFAAWTALFSERFSRLFGRLAKRLRPGAFHSNQGRLAGTADRLPRAVASQAANVTLSRGDPPFPGFGAAVSGWSAAIDVTRSTSSQPPRAFTAGDVHDHVRASLAGLGLPGLQLADQVFVTEAAASAGNRFRRAPGDPSLLGTGEETVRHLIDFPEDQARPYLTAAVMGWDGDLTVTTLVRFVRSPSQLFAEIARTVLLPLRPSAAALDGLGRWPGTGSLTAMAARSLLDTPWRLLASGPALAYRAAAPLRRARNRRRADRSRDHAARLSLREAAAAPAGRYFQELDIERRGLLIEQQILQSLAGFLADRNVAAPGLEPPGGGIVRPWAGPGGWVRQARPGPVPPSVPWPRSRENGQDQNYGRRAGLTGPPGRPGRPEREGRARR